MGGTKKKTKRSAKRRELTAARVTRRAERSARSSLRGTCDGCGEQKKKCMEVDRVISDMRPREQLVANRSNDKLFHCRRCTTNTRLRCAAEMKVSVSNCSLHRG